MNEFERLHLYMKGVIISDIAVYAIDLR